MNDLIMQNHWKTKHRFQKEDGSDGLMSSKDSVAKYKQVKESDPESLYKDVTDQAGSSGRGLLNIPIPESVDEREVDQLQIEVRSLRGFRTCRGVTSQALCLRRQL